METLEDCIFYQAIELPGMGLIPGSWDHRETLDVYLGHVDFNQKEVLDVGPANGFFSFEMEKKGASVTAIDLGQNTPWDVVPHPFLDEKSLISNMQRNVRMVEKAFWIGHAALNSKVKLVYGSVYDVPKVIKEVDIALMSNVLQHFRDPLMAIQRVAEVVKETIVITETIWNDDPAFIGSTSMFLIPRAETPEVNHSWWQVSPSFVIELLKLLGFPEIKLEYHDQKFNGASADHTPRLVKHFTLTAKRAKPLETNELVKLKIDYSSGFYDVETSENHVWRWSAGPYSEIDILNLESKNTVVSLYFGLGSIASDATIQVLVNGELAWEGGSFYGTKPVFVPSALLVPGKNIIRFISTGQPVGPTANDPRTLSYSLYDFKICRPAITSDA
jgi:SAM-dependent methyltransferase